MGFWDALTKPFTNQTDIAATTSRAAIDRDTSAAKGYDYTAWESPRATARLEPLPQAFTASPTQREGQALVATHGVPVTELPSADQAPSARLGQRIALSAQPLLGRSAADQAAAEEGQGGGFLDSLGNFAARALDRVNLPAINIGGSGQPISVTSTPAPGGLDTTALVLLGGALVVVVVLVAWK